MDNKDLIKLTDVCILGVKYIIVFSIIAIMFESWDIIYSDRHLILTNIKLSELYNKYFSLGNTHLISAFYSIITVILAGLIDNRLYSYLLIYVNTKLDHNKYGDSILNRLDNHLNDQELIACTEGPESAKYHIDILLTTFSTVRLLLASLVLFCIKMHSVLGTLALMSAYAISAYFNLKYYIEIVIPKRLTIHRITKTK